MDAGRARLTYYTTLVAVTTLLSCGADRHTSTANRDAGGVAKQQPLSTPVRKASLPATVVAPGGNALPGALVTLGAGELGWTQRLAFTATGLLSAGGDGVVRHWSLTTGEAIATLAIQRYEDLSETSIAFDVDHLVVHALRRDQGAVDAVVLLRTQQLGSPAFVDRVLPQTFVKGLEFLDDGSLRIRAQADHPEHAGQLITYRFDPGSGDVLDPTIDPGIEHAGRVEVGSARRFIDLPAMGRVLAGADCLRPTKLAGYSADGAWLLVSDYEDLRLWSGDGDHRAGVRLPKPLRRRRGNGAVSPDGALVLLPGYRQLVLWSPASGKVRRLDLDVASVAFDEASSAVALGMADGRIGIWILSELTSLGEPVPTEASPPPATCDQQGQPDFPPRPAAPFTVERRLDLQGVWRSRSATGHGPGWATPEGRTHIVFVENETWDVPPGEHQPSTVQFHDFGRAPAITIHTRLGSGGSTSRTFLVERQGNTLRTSRGGPHEPPPSFAAGDRIEVFELETDPQVVERMRVRP